MALALLRRYRATDESVTAAVSMTLDMTDSKVNLNLSVSPKISEHE